MLRPLPPSTRAAATTPAEPVGARVARFPTAGSLPRIPGGSASASLVSRPAQRSTSLRPAWSLNRPGRPFVVGVLQPMSLPPSSAPTATGWSDSCRAGFAPAEEWRLVTAHRNPTLSPPGVTVFRFRRRGPSGPAHVSYAMSHSTPCIRQVKENGTENRPDQPAEVGPVRPAATRGGPAAPLHPERRRPGRLREGARSYAKRFAVPVRARRQEFARPRRGHPPVEGRRPSQRPRPARRFPSSRRGARCLRCFRQRPHRPAPRRPAGAGPSANRRSASQSCGLAGAGGLRSASATAGADSSAFRMSP